MTGRATDFDRASGFEWATGLERATGSTPTRRPGPTGSGPAVKDDSPAVKGNG